MVFKIYRAMALLKFSSRSSARHSEAQLRLAPNRPCMTLVIIIYDNIKFAHSCTVYVGLAQARPNYYYSSYWTKRIRLHPWILGSNNKHRFSSASSRSNHKSTSLSWTLRSQDKRTFLFSDLPMDLYVRIRKTYVSISDL